MEGGIANGQKISLKSSPREGVTCVSWLEEIGISQYAPSLLANFSLNGNPNVLSIKKLSQLRQQDLPRLNITNFEHQRILIDHIKALSDNQLPDITTSNQQPLSRTDSNTLHTLPSHRTSIKNIDDAQKAIGNTTEKSPRRSISFASPSEEGTGPSRRTSLASSQSGTISGLPIIRPQEQTHQVQVALSTAPQTSKGKAVTESGASSSTLTKGLRDASVKGVAGSGSFAAKAARRRSFDQQVWNAIGKHKVKDKEEMQAAITHLRAGTQEVQHRFEPNKSQEDDKREAKNARRRRWTYNNTDKAEHDPRTKAMMFGNRALEFDIIQSDLQVLQDEILTEFKNIIGCEAATILFLNEATRELMFFIDNRWLRVAVNNSIAGACVTQGDTLHITNAYEDNRFNREVDYYTNFKTKDILCEPVRSRNGGGPIVAVVEMVNKRSPDGFDAQDKAVLKVCVGKVADMLGTRFRELLDAATIMYSNSELPGDVGVNPNHRFDAATTASKASANRDSSKLTMQEKITKSDMHGRGDAVKVEKSEAMTEERRRRQRRMSYTGGSINNSTGAVQAAMQVADTVTSEGNAAAPLPLVRQISEEKPRWVGKTAKLVDEIVANTNEEEVTNTNNE
mmetsp:Transcript_1873/g.1953  ORF Transcript_1873/g.1953 Transcript_1873/m.1953 type:complete len:623 (+) Transcript_1873:231-2099(+)|eukprot:CAMPEP_0182429452 /NCGR_PEP_ID=MMETSP1167-20130531/29115_1 /TAXON_ID=2988 /ORGANISM="Mallomonas Sp, Strain CCMP3275" /LENGTH=622 /DNA_ID=CAMNT_0024613169 /DNA_START=171 /DNA_END=2042 /DNA_ORIENTATION=-